jgi:hypothetical protein
MTVTQLSLFEESAPPPPVVSEMARERLSWKIENPCVSAFGRGPKGRRCGECARLQSHWWTGDPATADLPKCQLLFNIVHSPEWPACSCFSERRVA